MTRGSQRRPTSTELQVASSKNGWQASAFGYCTKPIPIGLDSFRRVIWISVAR
jgi:hypothetical protein